MRKLTVQFYYTELHTNPSTTKFTTARVCTMGALDVTAATFLDKYYYVERQVNCMEQLFYELASTQEVVDFQSMLRASKNV